VKSHFALLLLLSVSAGCTTTHAVRVRCDRYLTPINPPLASRTASPRGRGASAQGANQSSQSRAGGASSRRLQ